MTIKTKFNIGDMVYLARAGKIHNGKVTKVTATDREGVRETAISYTVRGIHETIYQSELMSTVKEAAEKLLRDAGLSSRYTFKLVASGAGSD